MPLEKALKRDGAKDIKITTIPAYPYSAIRIVASFGGGPFGFVSDDVEFILDASSKTAAFRAASSSPGLWPFSDTETARRRNRERLLHIRKYLFERKGWSCGCPADLDPFSAAKCALSCSL